MKNKMLVVIFGIILFTLLDSFLHIAGFVNFYLYEGLSYAQLADEVIAIVNKEVITAQDLQRRIESLKINPGIENLTIKDWNNLISSTLEHMIQELLILGEAGAKNIKVEEENVEKRIENIKKNYPDEKAFLSALDRTGLTLSQLREQYRRKMLIDKMINLKITQTIKIQPMEITNFYLQNKEKFKQLPSVKLRHIFIKAEDENAKREKLNKAYGLYELLNEGADFREVAFKYSEGPNAKVYGDMGYVKKGELLKELDEVIFTLETGQISEIISTTQGYHIVKIEEKKPGRIKSISEASSEIKQILFQKKAREKLRNWIDELKKDAYIWVKETKFSDNYW